MSKEKANERINSRVTPTDESHKPHVVLLVIVVAVVVAVLVGVICYLALRKDPEQEQGSRGYNRVVTPDNVEEIISQLQEEDYTPVGSYEVIMNTEWTFPDGTSPSTDAYVENSVSNRNTVYFTIALDTDRETDIYDSPFIEPGSYMDAIRLGVELPAGTYGAVLTYHLVDEQEREISHVSVNVTLTVSN